MPMNAPIWLSCALSYSPSDAWFSLAFLSLAEYGLLVNAERLPMGLTHSWIRPTELPARLFAQAVEDIRTVLASAEVPLAGLEGVGEPILRLDAVIFNGV